MKNVKYLVILLAAAILGGCVSDAQKESQGAIQMSIVENVDEEVSEESEEQDLLEELDESEELDEELIEDEPMTVEYVEWDGTGTIKKNGAAALSDMQYFDGKTYVVDRDDRNLGAEFPVVPIGDQLVEPVISKFLLTEDKLFYMEENPDVEGHGWDNRCYDLYVQFLETGEVKLLDTEVEQVVYQDGVVLCENYEDRTADFDERTEVIRKIDVETGDLLDEFDLGTRGTVYECNKDYIMYFLSEDYKDYCYWFQTKTSEEIVFPEGTRWSKDFSSGNMYAKIDLENGSTKIVQLYEQGKPVYRIFPKEFYGNTYCSCDKVFYEDDRKIMEYNLETGEERYLCDLGENQYGPHIFCEIQESNGMILLEESGLGAPGEYGTHYLYEVKDGVKTLVTNGFWTS